jgi:galactose mutarotase-like enzyme
MEQHILKSNTLTLKMNEHGAELVSIYNHLTNTEYLWNADPLYWKRSSPILFPFVGTLNNKSYTYNGQNYSMDPHGFARDMRFSLLCKSEDEIWFSLDATEETQKTYPFLFRLEIGYRLEERKITVLWRVINRGESTMYFSIGAHPAFMCPLNSDEKQSDYSLLFDNKEPLRYLLINDKSLTVKKPKDQQELLITDSGIVPIHPHMFDQDALIIEDNQSHQVSLLTPDKKSYVTVTFDAPLFGLWSPAGKHAPFVCIEPWYGRCDSEDFNGTLEEREWGNQLEANGIFEANYTIEISDES